MKHITPVSTNSVWMFALVSTFVWLCNSWVCRANAAAKRLDCTAGRPGQLCPCLCISTHPLCQTHHSAQRYIHVLFVLLLLFLSSCRSDYLPPPFPLLTSLSLSVCQLICRFSLGYFLCLSFTHTVTHRPKLQVP